MPVPNIAVRRLGAFLLALLPTSLPAHIMSMSSGQLEVEGSHVGYEPPYAAL